MTERTILLPPPGTGNGGEASYRLTVVAPKRQYLSYLRERWWVVVGCAGLMLAGLITYETLRPDTYTSFAQLYASGEVQLNVGSFFNEESLTYLGTQVELFKSARLQGLAFQKIGYTPKPGDKPPVTLEVTQPMKTSILVLQARGADPVLVQRFLQGLVDAYLAYKKETRRSTSEDVVSSLTDQLTQRERDLQFEQEKWVEFQRSNNVAVLAEEGRSAGMYLADLNLQLAKLKLDRELLAKGLNPSTDEKRWGTSGTNAAGARLADPVVGPDLGGDGISLDLSSDTALKSVRVELAVKRAERDQVLQDRGEMAARRLNEEVIRLERTAEILEKQTLLDKKAKLEALDKRIAALQASIPGLEAKVSSVNERISDGQRLKNDVQREQGFYDHLLVTLQNVDLGKNVQQERFSVLQPATIAVPVQRYLVLRALLAVSFGLLTGGGIVFGWYLFDDRFVCLREVKEQFGETVLGLVPHIRVPRSKPEQAVLQHDDPRKMYAESFRHLRSALLLSAAAGTRPQTLLVTAAGPGEGKTTLALNLARVMARGGLRAVLVDADPRGGGAGRLLGRKGEPGLMEFLAGAAGLSEILFDTDLCGLKYVPAGGVTGQPDDDGLLLSARLSQLVGELRKQADYVLVDGPPVLSAAAAGLLVPHADSVLFIVRPFFSRACQVRQALETLYHRRAKQVAIIFNQARKDDLAGHYAPYSAGRPGRNGMPG